METLSEQPLPEFPGQIEVLNRSGAVVRRIPLTSDPLTLGRDLSSDLILDDPYVCPQHALLQEVEGRLIVEDRGSVNGLSLPAGGGRLSRTVLASGEAVRVGHTTLRYRNAAAPLPPTLVDRSSASWLRHFERPALLVSLYLLLPILLLLNAYLETTSRLQIGKVLLTPILAIVMIGIWAALWAFANRIISYRWHFAIHLGIGCAGLAALQLWETFNGYLCFALNLDAARSALDHSGQTLVVALLLFAHLRFASFAPSRSLARAAVLISLAVLGLTFLPTFSEQGDFNSAPVIHVTIKAPPFKFVERKSPELFFKEMEKLPAELAKRAAEGKK